MFDLDTSFSAAATVLFPEATPPVNPMQRRRRASNAKASVTALDVKGDEDNEAIAIAVEEEKREIAAEIRVRLRDFRPRE